MVDEGENSFGVVSGDEFCGLADIVHVCAVGRAGHLLRKHREKSPNLAVPELPALKLGFVAMGGNVFRQNS